MTIPTSPDPMALHREMIKDHRDHREEYRRENAQHVEPQRAAARSTDKSAINLGQSVIKTATLLNGGAIIAIPAIVTLFGIDANKGSVGLIIAGGCFAAGLVFSWLSAVFGFFALSNRTDREWSSADLTAWQTNLAYYPPDGTEEGKKKLGKINGDIKKAEQKIQDLHKVFSRCRVTAILFSFLSLGCFLVGNVVGGKTVLCAPVKALNVSVQTVSPPPIQTIPLGASQAK